MSKDLISNLLEASKKIHQATIKGSGNYIITNPQLGKVFDSLKRQNIRKEKIKKILEDGQD